MLSLRHAVALFDVNLFDAASDLARHVDVLNGTHLAGSRHGRAQFGATFDDDGRHFRLIFTAGQNADDDDDAEQGNGGDNDNDFSLTA